MILKILAFIFILLSAGECQISSNYTMEEGKLDNTENTDILVCSKDDPNSVAHCRCEGEVISCDFSEYKSPTENRSSITLKSNLELDWEKWENIKRLCICGTPINVKLILDDKFIHDSLRIRRIDLYWLRGLVDIGEAFLKPRIGSIFIGNVSYIKEIKSFGFGYGLSGSLEVENTLTCCSPLTLPTHEEHLMTPPILSIENTDIGTIYPHGIDDHHRWSSLILRNVRIKEVGVNGIDLDRPGINVIFDNCYFGKAENFSVVFADFSSLVMTKSRFSKECYPYTFGARSRLNGSSLLIVGNRFENFPILEFDAQMSAIWLNNFNFWDDFTLLPLTETSFPQSRVISIGFNKVSRLHFPINSNETKIFEETSKIGLVFEQNLLSICDCKLTKNNSLPRELTDPSNENICGVRVKPECYLDYAKFKGRCEKDGEISPEEMGKICQGGKTFKNALNVFSEISLGGVRERAFGAFIKNRIDNDFTSDPMYKVEYTFPGLESKRVPDQAKRTKRNSGNSFQIIPGSYYISLIVLISSFL